MNLNLLNKKNFINDLINYNLIINYKFTSIF